MIKPIPSGKPLSAAQAAQKIFNQLVRCGYMLSAAQAAQKSDEKSHT